MALLCLAMEIPKRTPSRSYLPLHLQNHSSSTWLPDSVLVYLSVSFIRVSQITTLSAARQKGSPLEVKALLFGKLHTPQGNPTMERGTRPDFTHSNHVQNKRKHLSCQMEETKQISNYPPQLLLVSSQEEIRVTDGVGDPGGRLHAGSLSEGMPIPPQPAASCSSPTKWKVLLPQLNYIGELPLTNRGANVNSF